MPRIQPAKTRSVHERSSRGRDTARFPTASFSQSLDTLRGIVYELITITDHDDLCRAAVDRGRLLGFDRLGLWFAGPAAGTMVGSFGVDESGEVRDERDQVLAIPKQAMVRRIMSGECRSTRRLDVRLYNHRAEPVGRGWRAVAGLWHGDRFFGYIGGDSLITQRPWRDEYLELLSLYATYLAALVERSLSERNLRSSEARFRELASRAAIDAARRRTLGASVSITEDFGAAIERLLAIWERLLTISDFDDLCRGVVEMGRTLGFDRMSLWLADSESMHVRGTFGTDTEGNTCDERGFKIRYGAGMLTERIASGEKPYVRQADTELTDAHLRVVGYGWRCLAPLWHGDEFLGFIGTDNLISARSWDDAYGSLLSLYAGSVAAILQRARSEAALRSSEARYRALCEGANVGIGHVTMDGRFRYMNKRACEMLGYSAEELYNLTFQEVTHPDDLQRNLVLYRKARAGLLDHYALEKRYIRKDGSPLWASLSVGLIREEGGQFESGVAILQDITERKRLEAELKASEAKFRALCDNAAVGICQTSREGRFLYVNQKLCDILGYGAEDFKRLTFADITVPEDLPQSLEVLRSALAGDLRQYAMEKRYIHRDGRQIWASVSVGWVEDANAELQSFVTVIKDISDRKALEGQLKASEARFRALCDDAAVGICEVDLNGRFIYANDRLCALWGYAREELYALTFFNLIHPDEMEACIALNRSLVDGGTDRVVQDKRYVRKDGTTLWTTISVSALRESHGLVKSLVAVISDISERKELEAQLRSLAQELMVFQEEERKSIGRELHDEIGQLLTGLKLSIGLAESTAPKEHKASLKLPAQLVDQTFERVRALTQGLRPSMLDDLGLEPTLRWLFREVRKQTGLKITATIEGLGSHCSLSPECRIAAFRIVQEALTNVARHSGAKTAHVTVSRREDRLELSVEDKGSGFEPLAPGAKRMGTGLTGMQERVRALRGEFDILTQVGGGTIIRASWPAPENGMRRKAVRSASSVDTSSF